MDRQELERFPSVLELIRTLQLRIARDRRHTHFIEGFRSFLQAVDARVPIELLVYSEILARNPAVQKRARLAKREGTPVLRVTPEQFRALSRTPKASGIGAILRQHWTPLEGVDPRAGLCWIAVRFIRSPGNLGTLLRTAEAAGVAGILFLGDATDPFEPAVVRASMGGIFHLSMVRASLAEFAAWCRTHSCHVLGTSPSANAVYTDVDIDPPLVILFGEERAGLSAAETSICTEMARIPIVGRADSLNVGVSAGVLIYDVLRRRRLIPT